jgi:hypothetical protein
VVVLSLATGYLIRLAVFGVMRLKKSGYVITLKLLILSINEKSLAN